MNKTIPEESGRIPGLGSDDDSGNNILNEIGNLRFSTGRSSKTVGSFPPVFSDPQPDNPFFVSKSIQQAYLTQGVFS